MSYAITVRFSGMVVAGTLWAGAALAVREGDLSSKFAINDEDPIASIPSVEQRNADPLEFGYWLQDMVHRAELPFQESKWDEAIKYYEALRVALPETAINYGKLCTAYENLGELAKAEASCWTGLQYPATKVVTYYQYLRIAIAMLPQTAEGDAKNVRVERVLQTIEHLRAAAPEVEKKMVAERAALKEVGAPEAAEQEKDAASVPFAQQVEVYACQLGVALKDAQRLTECVTKAKAAGMPRSALVPFEWALLRVKGGSAEDTQALLDDAKRAGVPAPVLAALEQSSTTTESKPAVKYQAPLDSTPRAHAAQAVAVPVSEEQVGAGAALAEPSTSSVETLIAALAGLLGLGGVGWWLRERALRRSAALSRPATSQTSA